MIPLYSDAPPVVQIESQREIAPFSESRDVIDDAIKALDLGYALTGCPREAYLRSLEKLCDGIAPVVHAPRRSSPRISAKARRRTVGAIIHLIDSGRAKF
jgi:hypothetical protein